MRSDEHVSVGALGAEQTLSVCYIDALLLLVWQHTPVFSTLPAAFPKKTEPEM